MVRYKLDPCSHIIIIGIVYLISHDLNIV